MQMYKEVFHKRIKAARLSWGYSQTYVAAETGISQSKISKYETGDLEPTIEQLGILAKFYNASIDELIGHTVIKYTERRLIDEKNI